ncbi:MAG: response regulator [FCB group bacterium]|nr:response regulator [FCB group bacterium]
MADKKKILVVDDEPDVVKWLTVLFENSGYDVVSAPNGSEGFKKAEEVHPNLITLDITMPEESGIRMYRNLHESKILSDIPVIILTGVSPEFERFISTRSQVNPPAAYIEKPVNDEDLLNKVKELLG